MEGRLLDHQTCSSQRRLGKNQDFLFVEGACTFFKYTTISHQVKINTAYYWKNYSGQLDMVTIEIK